MKGITQNRSRPLHYGKTLMTSEPGWQFVRFQTLPQMQEFLTRLLGEIHVIGFTDKEVFGIRLALEEALVNAIKHGNRLDPTKTVHVRYQVTHQQFTIEIRDEGPGFDPEGVPDPSRRPRCLLDAPLHELGAIQRDRQLRDVVQGAQVDFGRRAMRETASGHTFD